MSTFVDEHYWHPRFLQPFFFL